MCHRHHPRLRLSCRRLKCDVLIYVGFISPSFSVEHRVSFHALLATKFPLRTKQSPEETQAQALSTTRGTEAAVLVAASIRLSPLLTLRLSVNTSSPQHQRHERTRCSDQPPRGAATDKTQVENWIHSYCCLKKAADELAMVTAERVEL